MLKVMLKFALVGFSGVGVNLLVYLAALSFGCPYLLAAVLAFAVAVTNNFVWNAAWTFRGRAGGKGIPLKYLSFFAISTVNLGVNLLLLRLLVESAALDPGFAQVAAIAAVSAANFLLNYHVTFGEPARPEKKEIAPYEADYHPHL